MATNRLSLRERVFLARKALTGTVTGLEPGSAGYSMLQRLYPATGEPPKRGTLGMLQAYSTSPWLRAVCGRIATSVAAVPWKLYIVRPKGKERAVQVRAIQRAAHLERKSLLADREKAGELVEVSEHLLLDALDNGNPYHVGLVTRKLTNIYLDTVGEVFWLKERNAQGLPIAFWPLSPAWVIKTPTVSQPYLQVNARGWRADIPDTEVVWMIDPDPAEPYARGSGAGQAVADEIDTDEAMALTVKQKFYNRAKPDVIIMPKNEHDTLAGPDKARLETEWVNRNQGFWKWFKPFFMSRAMEIKELSQDLSALQFVELRKHERDMILQVTGGLPPEMLGILESSNRATISAAKYLMDTQIVVPRLEFQRAYLQEKVVPEYDERLIVDYVNPVDDDAEQRLAAMTAAPYAPTLDEWRRFQGLPPLPDGRGEIHMVPATLIPTEALGMAEPPEPEPRPAEVPPPAAE